MRAKGAHSHVPSALIDRRFDDRASPSLDKAALDVFLRFQILDLEFGFGFLRRRWFGFVGHLFTMRINVMVRRCDYLSDSSSQRFRTAEREVRRTDRCSF